MQLHHTHIQDLIDIPLQHRHKTVCVCCFVLPGTPHGGATHNQTPAQAWRSEAQQPDDAAAEPDTSVLEYCMKNRARGL